jgi:hypothetical protein
MIQKPCGETLVTSTSEVCLPGPPDFLFMFPDQLQRFENGSSPEALILRQRNLWFQPELCFPIRRLHVYMHAQLLAGEEKEPQVAAPQDRGTHCARLRESGRLLQRENAMSPRRFARPVERRTWSEFWVAA